MIGMKTKLAGTKNVVDPLVGIVPTKNRFELNLVPYKMRMFLKIVPSKTDVL